MYLRRNRIILFFGIDLHSDALIEYSQKQTLKRIKVNVYTEVLNYIF